VYVWTFWIIRYLLPLSSPGCVCLNKKKNAGKLYMFEQEERHAGCMFEQEGWQSSNCLWSACFDAVGNLMHVCMRCMSSLARECNNYLNWNSHSGVSVWDYTYCMMEDCHVNSSLLVVSSRILTTFCLPSSRPAWSWIKRIWLRAHQCCVIWSNMMMPTYTRWWSCHILLIQLHHKLHSDSGSLTILRSQPILL